MGAPATKRDIKNLENLFLDKFAILESRLERMQTAISEMQGKNKLAEGYSQSVRLFAPIQHI